LWAERIDMTLRHNLDTAWKNGVTRVSLPILIMLVCGICLAQQPIRVRTHLVNIGFTARDAKGALVDNLAESGVEVYEDGVQQKLAYFKRSMDAPLALGLIVDTSGSQEKEAKRHQHDIELFLKNVLGPKDRAFLVCFENRVRLVSDFSQSGSELMERWQEFSGKETGNAKDKKEAKKEKEREFPDLGPNEKRVLGTAFYDAIFYSVSEKLAQEAGRRALLIFSDGEDNSSSHDMMSAIEAAQSSDVLIFTIRYTEDNHGKLTARNQYGIRVMERIAKETGGAQFDAKETDPRQYFNQIGEELRSMYETGYYSTNTDKDETFRKVVVRPTIDGIRIRSKPGYYAR
jgi:Ca-activated chloride channel family protein